MDIQQLQIDEAEQLWDSLLTPADLQPMYSYEWYKTWVSVSKEWTPYLLRVNNTSLVPLVRQGDTVQFIHRYTDSNDLIGKKEGIWPSILEYLKHDGVRKVELRNIPESSETVKFFKENNHYSAEVFQSSPALSLPDSFETYLSSIREKRKKYNKFIRECPEARIWESNNLEEDLIKVTDLMIKNAIKNDWFTTEADLFLKGICASCSSSIRIFFLELNQEIIAAQIIFLSHDTLMLYNGGFDRENFPNAGTYLIMSLIKYAIEHKFTKVDFLRGKEQYKYELGAIDYSLYEIKGAL